MGDGLGVDLGTTSAAAAIQRADSAGGRTELVQLGTDAYSLPSVVSLTAEGTWLCGDAAERRLGTHPSATVREFKRRFGDPAPIVVAGAAHAVESLTCAQLADVIRRVTTSTGARPDRLALSHPAAWGPFRLDGLRQVARDVGYDDVTLVAEPVAAAVANHERLLQQFPDGATVAVYDLGGGTFDAAVVRGGAGGDRSWSVIGVPEGVERLGGTDIDQAVLGHVDASLGGQVFSLDTADDDTRTALIRLRTACRDAKEHLSEDTEVEIPVELPTLRTSVRLTRSELEAMIRPRLADSLAVLDRVVASAALTWNDIDAVLLVGGSSRIPAVGQMVHERFGRPVIGATNPQLAVALGTAMMLSESAVPAAPAVLSAPPTDRAVPSASNTPRAVSEPATEGALPSPGWSAPLEADGSGLQPPQPGGAPSGRRRTPLLAGAVGLAALVAAVVFVFTNGGDDGAPAADRSDQSATTGNISDAPDASQSEPDAVATTTDAEGAEGADVAAGTGDASATTQGTQGTQGTQASGGAGTSDGDSRLEALGVVVSPCEATLPPDLSSLAVTEDGVVFVAGGVVATADLDSACGLGAATELATGPFAAVDTTSEGLIVASGAEGTEVFGPDGTNVECPELSAPLAMSDSSMALAWTDDGVTSRFDITRSGCEIAETDALPGVAIVAVTFRTDNSVVVAGRAGGGDRLGVSLFDRRQVQWTQDTFATPDDGPYRSIDGLARCGNRVCVVDAVTGRFHVVDSEGNHLGSLELGAIVGEGARFVALAETNDKQLLVAAAGASGVQLVQVMVVSP
jgi:molecular chaperone DnaK